MSDTKGIIGNILTGATAVLLIFTVFAALVNIPIGTDHYNMLLAFDGDEALGLAMLNNNLVNDNLDPNGVYEHGRVYQTVSFYTLKAFDLLGYTVIDRHVTLVLRYMSFLFFLLVLSITYLLLMRLGCSRSIALIAVLFTAAVPSLNHYGQIIHPDTLQTALILAALAIAVWRHSFANAFLASALCGVAMATKLGAIFLLPFLIVPASLLYLAESRGSALSIKKASYILARSILAALIFTTAFFLFYPQALSHEFIDRMRQLTEIQNVGWRKAESANPFLWFPIIGAQLSLPGSILLSCSMVFLGWSMLRTPADAATRSQRIALFFRDESNRTFITIGAYAVSVTVFFLFFIRHRSPHYLLPILPAFIILGFVGIDRFMRSLKHPVQTTVTLLAVLVITASSAYSTVKDMSKLGNRYTSPEMNATQWIIQNYGLDVTMAADAYTYAHPSLTRCIYGVVDIARDLPKYASNRQLRLLMISRNNSGNYAWKRPGTSLREGQIDVYPDFGPPLSSPNFGQFLRDVAAGRSPWKLVYESDAILIVENSTAAGVSARPSK